MNYSGKSIINPYWCSDWNTPSGEYPRGRSNLKTRWSTVVLKYLAWIKENINLVSFITGVVFIALGKTEVGDIIISNGAVL